MSKLSKYLPYMARSILYSFTLSIDVWSHHIININKLASYTASSIQMNSLSGGMRSSRKQCLIIQINLNTVHNNSNHYFSFDIPRGIFFRGYPRLPSILFFSSLALEAINLSGRPIFLFLDGHKFFISWKLNCSSVFVAIKISTYHQYFRGRLLCYRLCRGIIYQCL